METTQAVRRAVVGLCVVASLTAVACSSAKTGSTTSAPVFQEIPEGKFSAEFPSAPVREENRISASGMDLVLVSYTTETADESVGIAYVDYPRNAQLSLDGAAEGSAAQMKGTIQTKTSTTFMGHPAMDVVFTVDGGIVHERLVLRDRRLYTVIGASASGRPASYDRLIATLHLI